MGDALEFVDNRRLALRNYRDLRVWKASVDLALLVYTSTRRFPAREAFGLTAQLRRAAVSVASNIAEGHARSGTRDFLRFLSMAWGSLAEVDTQLHIAAQLCYVPEAGIQKVDAALENVSRMLMRLQQALLRHLSGTPH